MNLPSPYPLWHQIGQPEPGLSRQDWLTRQLRSAIVTGSLLPGARVPASRQLALDTGLSRNTVSIAYERLQAEGLLEMRVGSGTFVTQGISRRHAPNKVKRSYPTAAHDAAVRARSLATTTNPRPVSENRLPLSPGLPDPDLFPHALWSRLNARYWRSRPTLGYSDPAGLLALREAIAGYIGATRGVLCRADQLMITAGTQGAMCSVMMALLDPGAQVWVENPGYRQAGYVAQLMGATPTPVPVDAQGLNVARGCVIAPNAQMAIVSPSHQYPLGATMSLARRVELLDWAAQHKTWIVEDDYDGEYRYAGTPVKALKSLDRDERVIYCGTFSKLLAPGLRLGFLVIPEPLIEVMSAVRHTLDLGIATPLQATLADFIGNGHLGKHIRHTRARYDECRQQVLRACADMAAFEGVQGMEAGLHLLGILKRDDDRAIVARARAAGLGVTALSSYYHQTQGTGIGPSSSPDSGAGHTESGLLIGYATPGSGQDRLEIPAAMARLAAVLEAA